MDGLVNAVDPEISLIVVRGEDSKSLLQRITCNDLECLQYGFFQYQGILDTTGKILLPFTLFRVFDAYLVLLPESEEKNFLKQIEFYVFSETIEYHVFHKEMSFYIQGRCDINVTLSKLGWPDFLSQATHCIHVEDKDVKGYLFQIFEWESPVALFMGFVSKDHPALSHMHSIRWADYEKGRLQARIPKWGVDYSSKNFLLEIDTLHKRVSFEKGCYPGQEIVARTYFRGEPAKKLYAFTIKAKVTDAASVCFVVQGVDSGYVTSVLYSEEAGQSFCLGYLKKNGYHHIEQIECYIENKKIAMETHPLQLPMQASILAEYKACLQKGLDHYHHGEYDLAKRSLISALIYHPYGEDAMEAIALCCEKQGEYADALIFNKNWSYLDMTAVMARVNLSRVYMLLGDKDNAEHYQAKAQALEWKQNSKKDSPRDGLVNDETREIQLKDRQRKLEMFKEVLSLDEADEIANFGIGKIYLEMGMFPVAIKHLEKVILINPLYSAVYPLLGEGYLKQGDMESASNWLNQGLSVARQKGDLMPLKQIEQLLKGC